MNTPARPKYNPFEILLNTPWKIFDFLFAQLIRPFLYIYLKLWGVKGGKGLLSYDFFTVRKHRNSSFTIGHHVELRNKFSSNPLGVLGKCFFTTWEAKATLKIGNHVGITGSSICAAERIEIGDNTIIGSGCTIVDTDFHPISDGERRYQTDGIKSSPVIIEENVFIGMHSMILKGVKIGKNSVTQAGSLVVNDIPANSIAGGNPAKVIKTTQTHSEGSR